MLFQWSSSSNYITHGSGSSIILPIKIINTNLFSLSITCGNTISSGTNCTNIVNLFALSEQLESLYVFNWGTIDAPYRIFCLCI